MIDVISSLYQWFDSILISLAPKILIPTGLLMIVVGILSNIFAPLLYKPYSIIVFVLGVILSFGGFYAKGREDVIIEDQKKMQELKVEYDKLKTEQKEVTEKVVVKYITKIEKVKDTNEKLLNLVDTKNDTKCPIPESTISVLNGAAMSTVPDAASATDDSPSGVTYSQVERSVIENYSQYNEVAEQLRQLQDWIRQQQKLSESIK